jgi:plastocyanin
MSKKARRKAPPARKTRFSTILFSIGAGSLIAVVLIAGFLAFNGDDEPRRSRLRQEPVVSDEMDVTVDVIDSDYEPRDLTVPLGARITWDFVGDLPHTVTDVDGNFDSGVLDEGESYRLTFESAGEYAYYCTLHHAMQGKLTVVP